MDYHADNFRDLAETKTGRALWRFLNEHDNLIRLETASELQRPALEALATRMDAAFDPEIHQDRWKQMIGHMTRQVMDHQGFHLDAQGIKVRCGNLFSKASRYCRR